MARSFEGCHSPVTHPLRLDTDTRDELPRESLLDQKLSLLALLAVTPIHGFHGVPVDLIQLRQVRPIFEIASAGIRKCERTAQVVLFSPGNGQPQVRLEMHNGTLAASIGQLRMIRPTYHVEHDGARTEVERNARAHMERWMAMKAQLCQPAGLDVIHTNRGSERRASSNLCIAQKATGRDDGRQSVYVNDVVDLSLLKCVWVAAAPVLCLHSRGTASRSTRRASGSHRRDARSPAACC